MAGGNEGTVEPQINELEDGSAVVSFADLGDAGAGRQQEAPRTDAAATGERREEHDEGDDDEAAARAREIAEAKTDEEREAIRARRRQERADKKRRQQEREDQLRADNQMLKQQMAQMQEQLAVVTRKTTGAELAQVDAAIKNAKESAAYYKELAAEATSRQDGKTAVEATEKMVRAQMQAEGLERMKQQRTQQASQQRPAMQPQVDPLLAAQANQWMAKNSWYNPQGNDTDSRIVLALDGALAQEGYDPRTPGYWEELSKRVDKYIPHRASTNHAGVGDGGGQEDNGGVTARGKPKQGSPVAGGGREGGGGAGGAARPGQFTLSPARVAALKEAGMWDDPKARADAIRRYYEHDRQQATQR